MGLVANVMSSTRPTWPITVKCFIVWSQLLRGYTKVGLATHPPPAGPSEKAARKARATVIGFEREDDAHAFRRAFVRPNAQAT